MPNDSLNELTNQHKYFVAMYHGTFGSELQAVAAAIPSGAVDRGEFETADGSKLMAFKSPSKTTDTMGLEVLILERAASDTVRLWLSATDLSRTKQSEADDDVENFKEVGGGAFRVFERKEAPAASLKTSIDA